MKTDRIVVSVACQYCRTSLRRDVTEDVLFTPAPEAVVKRYERARLMDEMREKGCGHWR